MTPGELIDIGDSLRTFVNFLTPRAVMLQFRNAKTSMFRMQVESLSAPSSPNGLWDNSRNFIY